MRLLTYTPAPQHLLPFPQLGRTYTCVLGMLMGRAGPFPPLNLSGQFFRTRIGGGYVGQSAVTLDSRYLMGPERETEKAWVVQRLILVSAHTGTTVETNAPFVNISWLICSCPGSGW